MPEACGPHDPGDYPRSPEGSQPPILARLRQDGAQGVARLVRNACYGLRRATPWITARICDQMGYLSVTAGTCPRFFTLLMQITTVTLTCLASCARLMD